MNGRGQFTQIIRAFSTDDYIVSLSGDVLDKPKNGGNKLCN